MFPATADGAFHFRTILSEGELLKSLVWVRPYNRQNEQYIQHGGD